MSRTKRNIPKSRSKNLRRDYKTNDEGEFIGEKTPWKDHKLGLKKHMDSTRGGTKYKPGHGGINCSCCTKFPPDELKVIIRRYERRKDNQKNYKNYKDYND